MKSKQVALIVTLLIGFIHLGASQSSNDPVRLLNVYSCPYSEEEGVLCDTLNGTVANFGLTTEIHRLLIEIECKDDRNEDFILYIDNPLLDRVRIFSLDTLGDKVDLNSGESTEFSSRIHGLPAVGVDLDFNYSGRRVFEVLVESGDQILLPIKVGRIDAVVKELQIREIVYAIYVGLILVMVVYNLFIYFSVRDRVYIYYVLYILTVGLTQLVISGYANKYFWPESPKLAILASSLIPIFSGLGTIAFSRNFIRTKEFAPFIDKLLTFYFIAYMASACLALMGKHVYAQYIINFNAASALILVIAAIKASRGGYRPARFFLVAFSFFLVGVTLYALRNFGILPFNNVTNYGLPIGSALETVLLSFALADRINQFKREKEESQAQMIEVMQENQKLIEEQNVRLEQMVHERTADLEKANEDLGRTLDDLRITQKQLVESEKLASLGQMTAGIAHEINNPINFVQSNVQPLRRDVQDIVTLLEEFARLKDEPDITSRVTELHKRYQELDMDYLKKEVEILLNGIDEGSRRTAEIVKGLRIFSRMDRDSLISAGINDCLNSTLIVMKSMTKNEVTIVRDFTDDLPNIDCYPGKLNQVFMNVITNAVQATQIAGRTQDDRIIRIRTEHCDGHVRIIISDNGVGIDPSIIDRIFDPFFTTKQVGEGTGLGLSIVRGIVDEHEGTIEVHSELGKGSTFSITLPRHLTAS